MPTPHQRLLEGEVVDNGDGPPFTDAQRLRDTVERLSRERDRLLGENADLRHRLAEIDEPIARLRDRLAPFYQLLQAIFGDIEELEPGDAPTAGAAPAGAAHERHSPIWESWKSRLPGAPAKIIDALLLHGDASMEQLVVLTQISRRTTLYDAIHRMNKAGIINKNGGRFSLKKLG